MFASELEQAIYRTLAWFSLFDFPLTSYELWKWLWSPGRSYFLLEVQEALLTAPFVVSANGFYALRVGRPLEELLTFRHDRFLQAERKYRKLRRVTSFFALLPNVLGVAAVNTLGWWHVREHSDIDLLIIVKEKTLWLSRLLLVTPFVLFGQRPQLPEAEET